MAAHAVEPGLSDDRLHGYAVLGDLSKHYSSSDLLYLAIQGELPDERASRVFALAHAALATLSVREAPAHVAILSRICGAHLSSALGAGAITLAESAHRLLDEHAPLLAWLAHPDGDLPPAFHNPDPADTWVTSLVDAARAHQVDVSLVRDSMSRDAARLALLFEAGICDAERMQAAIIATRFTGVVAEALLSRPEHLNLYPVKLPPYQYVEPES